MKIEASVVNPYPNRTLPVGRLGYDIKDIADRSVRRRLARLGAPLEKGECELTFSLPFLFEEYTHKNFLVLGDRKGGITTVLALGALNAGLQTQIISANNDRDRARLVYEDQGVNHMIHQYNPATLHEYIGDWGVDLDLVFINCHDVRDAWKRYGKSAKVVAFHNTNQERVDEVVQVVRLDRPLTHWVNRVKVFQK